MQAGKTTLSPAGEKQAGIMLGRGHASIGRAAQTPVPAAAPVVAVSPVALPAPGRVVDLELKVTAPATGGSLPVILYSHGGGVANFLTSCRSAGPLVDFKDFTWELSSKGADYHADPYTFSPGPKSLLTLSGGEHLLGGVTGYDAAGTTDENQERVAVIQRLSLACLRSALYEGDPSWAEASAAFAGIGDLGSIENSGGVRYQNCRDSPALDERLSGESGLPVVAALVD